MQLIKKWNRHLKENNMTYFEHMFFASTYGFIALLSGLYLLVHAILPCFFQDTGSNLIKKLNKVFSK
jgi:hypothetical protein